MTIRVTNTAPVALADGYSVSHDRPLNASAATGILANDQNWDGDSITIELVSGVSHGDLTLNANGSFTYTPDAEFVGTDSFTYRLHDSVSASGVVTVTVNVQNAVPVGPPRLFVTPAGTGLNIPSASGLLIGVTDADADSLTAALAVNASHGTAVVNADGSFTYTPNAGFVGTDSFTYTVDDGTGQGVPIPVTVTVWNQTPQGGADTYLVQPGTPLVIGAAAGVLSNDRNDSAGTPGVSLTSSPSHGSLTLNADGSFTYTPNAGYTGPDSFTYTPSDGLGAGTPVTVNLNVTASAFVAANNTYVTGAGPP